MDGAVFQEMSSRLNADDFYLEKHRHIFRAMQALADTDVVIDATTLIPKLRDQGKLEASGGVVYVAGLTQGVPTIANLPYYAGIIKQKSIVRRIIQIAGELQQECYGDVEDVDELLTRTGQTLMTLNDSSESTPYRSLRDVVKVAFQQIEERQNQTEKYTGVRTGFNALDDITSGWQGSDLIIIAARPAMGKTAFTLNMMTNAAVRFSRSVLFCSLEMGSEQLAMRLLASEARVDMSKVRTGQLTEGQWSRLLQEVANLAKAPIWLDDTPSLTPQLLLNRARRLNAEHGLDMVIIDYLQLMETSAKVQSREQQISDISRRLKMLAKELQIPVIALSQLNRGVEQRTEKRPMMSDLRESGAIEQDADIIAFLYRDEYYNEDSEDKGIGEVIIGKHRSGSLGTVKLKFFPQFTRFENLAMQAAQSP